MSLLRKNMLRLLSNLSQVLDQRSQLFRCLLTGRYFRSRQVNENCSNLTWYVPSFCPKLLPGIGSKPVGASSNCQVKNSSGVQFLS